MKKLSASLQDYLETILQLSADNGGARITDIAKQMNIAKPSVNQAISTLKNIGLAEQDLYGPVRLTADGRVEAEKVIARHHAIKTFLTKKLGVCAETAETDACAIEHVISQETLEKLLEFIK